MKPAGKPDAGNPHVRFDERGRETERTLKRHRALPRLYRSTDVSAMHSSIRMGVASYSSRTQQASKIAMAADRSCESRAASSHSSNAFLLMAVVPVRRSQTPR